MIMNAPTFNLSLEPRWRTYLKASAFLAPPVFLWAMLCIFAFPKLKQLWADAGFFDPTLVGFMQMSDFFMHHGIVLGVSMIALLSVIEWQGNRWWPRYRRLSVGTLVFLLNSAMLILITAMLCSAIAAAPALMRLK